MNRRADFRASTLAPSVRVAPRRAPAGARAAPESMQKMLASAIYEGSVRHRRHSPHAHAFSYRVAMLYLDLDEVDRVFNGRWLWSSGRRNLVEFRRSDFLGDPSRPLDTCVRDAVALATGRAPDGPIRLLTHLRTFGHSFNPVSFYYCFEADGHTLHAVVAEVTNTPWKQRHAYVLEVAKAEPHGRAWQWRFAKQMHVSPFMAMEHDYAWRFSPPGDTLRVHMDVLSAADPHARAFDATLVLERRALDGRGLARALWRYPLMTTRIVLAIHWQALRLWLRGNPVHTHPDKKAATR